MINPSRPSVIPEPEDRLAVLKIQRTCVHDGPGLRTTVFFRGCAMRCRWCQNPEAQSFGREADGSRVDDLRLLAPSGGSAVEAQILAVVRQDAPYYSRTEGGVTLSGG